MPASRSRRIRPYFAATLVACSIFILSLATTASAQQTAGEVQSYTEIPPAPTMAPFISKDGSTVLLWCKGPWSQSRGIEAPPVNSDPPACVQAISANGAAFAGIFWKSYGQHLFVWQRTGQFREIGKTPGAALKFVSNDGSIVIWTEIRKGERKLFRWTQAGGTKDLGDVVGDVRSVSADGSVLVGCVGPLGAGHGFRWTPQGGLQDFPAMDHPLGISTDGNVILGMNADHVIRWTQARGAEDLGVLKINGKNVDLADVAIGGVAAEAVIVGWLSIRDHDHNWKNERSFVWTQTGGGQDIGLLGGNWSDLLSVSSDGTMVTGHIAKGVNYVGFVSPLSDLLKRSQTIEKDEQARAQAEVAAKSQAAAAQAEQDAKAEALAADQQARYDKAIAKGRPIQIYSLAGDLEDEGRPDLAAGLYQTLIDKFPDDPYAAKAVDKKDAARAAAQQQQQQAQDSVNQASGNAATAQNVEACIQQCSSTLNSCKSDAQNQHDAAVAKGLVGMISRNTGMMGGASTDSQNADSAKSACDDAYSSCSSACQ